MHCYGVMGTKANPSHAIIIQYNSINMVTNGPKKFGCIKGTVTHFCACAVSWFLSGGRWPYYQGFFTRRCMAVFVRWQKKNYPNNEVAVRRGFNVLLFCTSPYCMSLLAQYYAIFELNLKILFFFQICGWYASYKQVVQAALSFSLTTRIKIYQKTLEMLKQTFSKTGLAFYTFLLKSLVSRFLLCYSLWRINFINNNIKFSITFQQNVSSMHILFFLSKKV